MSGHSVGVNKRKSNIGWLLFIVCISFCIRLVMLYSAEPLRLRGDEMDYIHTARVLVEENRFFDMYRPPLYPVFQAGILVLKGGIQAIRIIQILISVLLILIVYRIACEYFSRKAACFAAIIVAFDPVLMEYSYMLLSETVFVFLFIGALYMLLVKCDDKRLIFAGVLVGLAGLTRSQIISFIPFLLLWMYWFRSEKWGLSTSEKSNHNVFIKRCILLLIGCLLVILPWTIRNYCASDAFVLIDVAAPMNLLMSTHPDAGFVDKATCWKENWTLVDGIRYRLAARQNPRKAQKRVFEIVFRRIVDAPGWFLRKSIWEAGHLWTLDTHLLIHLRNGWYGNSAKKWLLPGAVVVTSLYTVFLYLAGFFGLTCAERSGFRTMTVLTIFHATLIYGLVFASSRYTVPLRPLLAISAGFFIANRKDLSGINMKNGLFRWRNIVFILIIVVFLCIWALDLPLLWDMLINHGANFTRPQLITF